MAETVHQKDLTLLKLGFTSSLAGEISGKPMWPPAQRRWPDQVCSSREACEVRRSSYWLSQWLWTFWGSSDVLQGAQVQWHCRRQWVIWEAAELCLDPQVPAATWLWNTPGKLQGSELLPVPLKWTLEIQSLSCLLFCTLLEKNRSRFNYSLWANWILANELRISMKQAKVKDSPLSHPHTYPPIFCKLLPWSECPVK